jgi:CRP/FNR family transcriptional regulator, nitrogen oxide reductase regulator
MSDRRQNRRHSPVEVDIVPPAACSVELRLEILGNLPFFATLSPADVAAANERFRELGFAAGDTITFSDDPAASLYVVASGQVKLLHHTLAGKDVLLDVLTPGEFFGNLSAQEGATYLETAIAQTDACILAIPTAAFRAILGEHPAAALAVLDLTAQRLQSAQERVRQLSAYSVEQRIAVTLLRLAEKLGDEREVGWLIQTPLSRDDLAQMTGTTPESASRVMSQLQKDGLIASGRQWVAITDRFTLEERAGEAA